MQFASPARRDTSPTPAPARSGHPRQAAVVSWKCVSGAIGAKHDGLYLDVILQATRQCAALTPTCIPHRTKEERRTNKNIILHNVYSLQRLPPAWALYTRFAVCTPSFFITRSFNHVPKQDMTSPLIRNRDTDPVQTSSL